MHVVSIAYWLAPKEDVQEQRNVEKPEEYPEKSTACKLNLFVSF